MSNQAESAPDTPAVLKELLDQSERLVHLQLELLRSEVADEVGKAGSAAAQFASGAGLLAAGGVLSAQALVHLLHRNTRLPLWACYGLAAGASGAAGALLLASARREAAGLQLPALPKSAAALKENLSWLKEQATDALAPDPTTSSTK